MDVIQPVVGSRKGLTRMLRERVTDALEKKARRLASAFGEVKDIQLSHVTVDEGTGHVYLYPIWIGSYEYEGEHCQVQVDGHTGKIFVESPTSVKKKRFIKWAIITAAASALAGIAWVVHGMM
ncbi:hypothetical protein D6779_08405 [Candidatus Parcubacteria bacterium]|nr:MAG: hypothetical protein D6779_08405 [Candidatus Parcubacteria bacterium]